MSTAPPLEQIQQLLGKEENVAGTQESLGLSEVFYDALEPEFGATVQQIETQRATPHFTRTPPLPGLRTSRIRTGFFCAGNAAGSITTLPPFDLFLRLSGHKRAALKAITFSTFATGTIFKSGKIFTATPTSSATGRVVGTLIKGDGLTTLLYEPVTGVVDDTPTTGDTTLTIDDPNPLYDASLTLTASTLTDGGYGYIPQSKPEILLTIDADPAGGSGSVLAGELVVGGTTGALGVVTEDYVTGADEVKVRVVYRAFAAAETITFQTTNHTAAISAGGVDPLHFPTGTFTLSDDGIANTAYGARAACELAIPTGEPARFTFDLQGIFGAPGDLEPLAGAATAQATAPRVVSAQMRYDKGADSTLSRWIPVTSDITFRGGQRLITRRNPESAEGADFALETGREPQVVMNAESVRTAVRDYWNDFRTQAPGPRLRFRWGTIGSGNAFELRTDASVISDVSHGDNEGLRQAQITFSLRGDTEEDEYVFLVI